MKHMLKLALSALLCFVFFTSMQAQPPAGGERPMMDPVKRAEDQTALMAEKLGLSEAQTAKVKEVNLKYAEKAKTLRAANADGDRTKMREQMTALRTEQETELKTMLTSDQWAAWEKVQAEQRANRPERGKNKDKNKSQAPPPPPPAPPTGGQ